MSTLAPAPPEPDRDRRSARAYRGRVAVPGPPSPAAGGRGLSAPWAREAVTLLGPGRKPRVDPPDAKGPASCNAMPHAARSTLATSSQNRPRPRQPAKNAAAAQAQAPRGSVGDRRGSAPPSPWPAPAPPATGSRCRRALPDRTSGNPPAAWPGSVWRSAADRSAVRPGLSGVPPWFFSTWLRSASRSGPKRGVSSRDLRHTSRPA